MCTHPILIPPPPTRPALSHVRPCVPPFPQPHYHPTRKRPKTSVLAKTEFKCATEKSRQNSRSQRALKKRKVARKQLEHGNRSCRVKVDHVGDHKTCEGMQSSNAVVKSSPLRLPQGISEPDSLKIVEPLLFMVQVPFKGWRGCVGASPRIRSRSPAGWGSRCALGPRSGATRGSVCGGRVGVRG